MIGFAALCLRFSGFGILCFGGGYMLVPLLFDDLVVRRGTLTAAQFANLVSVAQLTPGPVGINAATYSGYIESGVAGSIAATVGLVLPTLILAACAVSGMRKYRDRFFMRGILTGVRPAALGMIGYAAILFLGLSVFPGGIAWRNLWNGIPPEIDGTALVVFLAALFAFGRFKAPAIAVILGGAAVGAVAALL